MASRLKEDEKNERIIRNLLKLPDNRRCINCNSLGPQYVCTNFSTFVCTNCSGIHREFTHRVKSISMAKFTSQEVSALQGGGNASAKEIYLKEWDPQRQSLPDGSNVERLRDFIKHVYVDRRYTGERSFEKPPRGKMGETEDSSESRRSDSYQGGSRSPPYEDTYERRYGDRPGGRSPGYGQENRLSGDNKRSPARPEIVNDWRRDDRFGSGRASEDGRTSDGVAKFEQRSPDRQRDFGMSSPPVVRPVRDILGENVSPLRVIEPPKAITGRSADGSIRTQRTASSSSLASSNGNPSELKRETSLIDFDAEPEPHVTAAVPPAQQPTNIMSPPTTSSADNWANFDSVPDVKASQAPPNANPLESVLLELSGPTSVSSNAPGVPGNASSLFTGPTGNASVFPPGNTPVANSGSLFGLVDSAAAPLSNPAPVAPNAASVPIPGLTSVSANGGLDMLASAATGGQWPNKGPQQVTSFPSIGGQSTSQSFTPAVIGTSGNQPWNPVIAPSMQGPPGATTAQTSETGLNPTSVSGVGMQPTPAEIKSSERKALPEDLFSMNYLSYPAPAPAPGWHVGPMGFNMQYNMPMPMPTYPQAQPAKSSNPFDVNDPTPVQAPMFPSMTSLQGALPNVVPPPGLQHTSSLGNPASMWMTPSNLAAMPPPSTSYASFVPPSAYGGQPLPSNMPARPQAVAGFGMEAAAFGSSNPNQQMGGLHTAPTMPNSFSSVGGNPFG